MSPPIELRTRTPLGDLYRSPLGAFGPGEVDLSWVVQFSEQRLSGEQLIPDCSVQSGTWTNWYLEMDGPLVTSWASVTDETDVFTWTGQDSGAVAVLSPPFDCDGTTGNTTVNSRWWYGENLNEYQEARRLEVVPNEFFVTFRQATIATPSPAFIKAEKVDLVRTRWPELTGTLTAHSASTPADAGLNDALVPCAIEEFTVSPTPESQRVFFNMTTNREDDLDTGKALDVLAYTFVGETSGQTLRPLDYAGTFFYCDLLNLADDAQSFPGVTVASAIIDTRYPAGPNVTIDFRTNPGLFGPAYDILGGWIAGETVNAYKVWP